MEAFNPALLAKQGWRLLVCLTIISNRVPKASSIFIFKLTCGCYDWQKSFTYLAQYHRGLIFSRGRVGGISAEHMELLAMVHVMHFAGKIGILPGNLESDCLWLISLLHDEIYDRHPLGALLDDAKEDFDLCGPLVLSFVPQNTNKVAHVLVRYDHSLVEATFWLEEIPENFNSLPHEDIDL
ncbi:uncharacterized protein A4U43_C03F21970 [Asparagus officinalis]|uniref:RNase H type-1 domain-containing protein n=1 Tax=Asparagus officinalis TaxID=4686 RepID=A0A5P1FGZ5_ASPOF|nr:uncharacterized protein A4U43_C03F21970 [Asparagus officinalis]